MGKIANLIKDFAQDFLLENKLSAEEQLYFQELIPFYSGKDISIEVYIQMLNETASFRVGEMARLIKQFLLLNDLLAKDNARIIKEQLILFRRFFHHLLIVLHKHPVDESTRNRLDYVIIKIDTYLKKYAPYLSV